MTWIIKFLKFVLCVEDEEREASRYRRNYDYQRLSSADPYSRTSIAHGTLRSQSDFRKTTTSSGIPNKGYESSGNARYTQSRESIQRNSAPSRNVVVQSCTTTRDLCNKVPVVSSQFNHPSSVKQPSDTANAKLSISKVPPKPSHTLPSSSSSSSSSSADVFLTTKASQVLNQVTKQSSANDVFSVSSQRSQPSSDLPSYLHSCRPPAVTTKSTSSSVPEKSGQNVYKPKDLSKLLSLVSDTEKQSPTSKKEPPLSTHRQPESPKPPPLSSKPTLSPLLSSSTSQQKKNNYVWVEKSASTTYVFPVDIKSLIEKDIVPGVLKMPLSPTTYKDYFHALLYAEDCYLEKWEGFEVKNVTLELHDAKIYSRKGNSKRYNAAVDEDEKVFVAFDIDKILERQSSHGKNREKRPFLLSRDFVLVKPTGSTMKPFQGVIYRVVKSSLVLAEFEESFLSHYDNECEYDVGFSFNRVCLKRAHHAIATAPETLYKNFLFPDSAPKQELPPTDLFINHCYRKEALAVRQILRLQGAPPYLVEGPISVVERKHLSTTGLVIVEAIARICRTSPSNRVLLCAPLNNTCDVFMRDLKNQINESDMFRANAAFREIDGVPEDILPSCLYKEEMDCFTCPSLEKLKKYKVISSTFMSSFRLRDEGMVPGHFSHIFLVDASSVTEPEAMVPLANLANSRTIVVVTGAPGNRSGWIRSQIARENGLRISYFERLQRSKLYKDLDPRVIAKLEDKPRNSNESSKSFSSFIDLLV